VICDIVLTLSTIVVISSITKAILTGGVIKG
jgi:hypothetical protein